MSFTADYTVDELDFLSFARINRYIRGRVSRKLLRVLTAAAALIFAGLCVTLTMRGAWTAKNAIIIAIGVLLIVWELRRDRALFCDKFREFLCRSLPEALCR